jgi:general secretion pathway protein B
VRNLLPKSDQTPSTAEEESTERPEPISFWEVPQAVRDDLPDLHITALVFANSPEDRFVMISGRRWVERDQLESGLVLEEIRRDGAIFWYRNYRFLVND